MADIFDEVNEDLRAERAQRFAKQYGGWLIALVLLTVAGVGGWQAWRWNQIRQNEAVATTFLGAMRDTTSVSGAPPADAARTAALDTYAKIAGTAPEGYRTLARLRAAALKADAGDLPGASALWTEIAQDSTADPLLRDLATLTWAQRQVDAGDAPQVQARLQPLLATGNPWRPLALECQAWILIRTGQEAQARELLKILVADTGAPDGVRGRANGLLTRLGGAAGAGG